MGSYSIGEALQQLLNRSKWSQKVFELRIHQEWELIVGKTIAKYTKSIVLKGKTLTVYTDIAALKQELYFGRNELAARINEHFGDTVVQEVIVK